MSFPETTMSSGTYTTYNNLLIENSHHILTITINRPDKLNALNIETIAELGEVMQEAYDDDKVRGILITGTGAKSFVAGADISEIAQLDASTGQALSERGHEVFRMIEYCPKPVVAAVNGFALGGGCELAMACHIRVASNNAIFGQPEVNLGVIPGYGGTQRLAQLIGRGKALELLMTGDSMNAEDALQWGLVNHLTTPEELLPKCHKLLSKIISKGPIAVGKVIESVNAAFDKELDGYQTEAQLFAYCCDTEDFREGTRAFMEKRKPVFSGK